MFIFVVSLLTAYRIFTKEAGGLMIVPESCNITLRSFTISLHVGDKIVRAENLKNNTWR